MERNTDHYVYALLDPSKNYDPFYVGKGRGYRVLHHYTPKYLEKKNYKSHTINKYRRLGYQDCYVILGSGLTEEESFTYEKILISFAGLRKDGGLLVNVSLGGEGSSGCNQPKTQEHKHSIITPFGKSWSLVFTTAKKRDWGFLTCED